MTPPPCFMPHSRTPVFAREKCRGNGKGQWWLRRTHSGKNAAMGIAVLLTVSHLIFNFGWFFEKSSQFPTAIPTLGGKPPSEVRSEKWVVVTSIANVTDDVRRLASLEGWKVVVVGDKKSPPIWRYPNCTFLSLKSQADLQYEIHDHLPFNSYARKTLGYLYAIEHGAQFVYDTDDDNKPLSDHLQFDFRDSYTGIRAESTTARNEAVYWNAYTHFGRPDAWPRGFPLQRIRDKNPKIQYRLYDKLKPGAIQQGLVDRDPDVDAIYRLVAYSGQVSDLGSESRRVRFDSHAPSIQLGPGVYTPFNSQNTLFRHEAFWALYIPVSTSFRVCDIWRGYWALRLLAEIDESLTFHTANAVQYRNAHNYFRDYLDEKALYEQAQSLVEHLHAWSCPNRTFRACALDLAQNMASNGYWAQKDVRGIEIWFRDLARLGYTFPMLRRASRAKRNDARGTVKYVSSGRLLEKNFDHFQQMRHVLGFCRAKLSSAASANGVSFTDSWQRQLKELALIIVLNRQYHGTIPLLQTLYDPWFANTIFCSSFHENPLEIDRIHAPAGIDRIPKPFSYINLTEEEMDKGRLSYACLSRTIEMGMHVDGYLIMGDDVLYNFWTPFDTTRLNFVSGEHCEALGNSSGSRTAAFWQGPSGRRAVDSLKTDTAFLSRLNVEKRAFLLKALSEGKSCNADVYYVPNDRKDDFLLLANRFLKAGVFLELAVPKIFSALGWSDRDGASLRGNSLSKKVGVSARSLFSASDHFLHPFKTSFLKDVARRKEFCETYGKVWLEIVYSTIES